MINFDIVLFPILLLAIIIGGVVLLIKFSSKQFPALRRKERWLLPLYGAVLIACGIVLAILDPFEEHSASGEGERRDFISLYDHMYSGNTEGIDAEYIRKDWEFTYSEKVLQITSSPSEELMASIFVEKVAGLGDEIEVIYYETPLYMNGEDMSGYIHPPDVTLSDGVVNILNPGENGYQEVELNMLRDPFTFNQFTGRTFMGDENGSTIIHGENVILIRVGEEKTLDLDPDSYIEYVNE
ncbi:hypothetical protein [Oceanobacillus manasiensis]|uniref:hypothetical protein n=1 Tax=Oceanobacillus manasiensis TaxID=586413 RepID=UPI0005A727E4|nr:hypothetical protein [Oceanobacillus manasiensis]